MTAANPARPWQRKLSEDDIGRYLGLVAPGVWLLVVLYILVFGFQALVLGGPPAHTPLGILALLLDVAGAVILATPSATPLPLWRTLTVVGIVAATVILITWQQDFHNRLPGYEAWELGANNLLMFALAIRGRVLAAWIAEAASIALIAVWSVTVSGSPLYGISMSYGQPVTLVACTAFAIGLHRTARQIVSFRVAERERAARESLDRTADRGDELALQIVRDLAEPTLIQIAEGGRPDPRAVRGLEAALRDFIRGSSLTVEPLVTTLRAARERGADIVLLDDLGDHRLPAADLARAASWCAQKVIQARGSTMTIRIAVTEDVPTVTFSDGDAVERLALRS
jgi:hypothetical protein